MGDVTSGAERSVRDLIEGAHVLPGGKLPSERILAADLGVGRTTIRLVLMKLAAEGLIRPEHGRGYFVNGADE